MKIFHFKTIQWGRRRNQIWTVWQKVKKEEKFLLSQHGSGNDFTNPFRPWFSPDIEPFYGIKVIKLPNQLRYFEIISKYNLIVPSFYSRYANTVQGLLCLHTLQWTFLTLFCDLHSFQCIVWIILLMSKLKDALHIG